MAGEKFPVVLLPRFSTLAGESTFKTVALDVSLFEGADIAVWRGYIVGPAQSFSVTFKESSDQDVWVLCNGSAVTDPGVDTELVYTLQFTRRFFRVEIQLGEDDLVTCYVAGTLDKRRGAG